MKASNAGKMRTIVAASDIILHHYDASPFSEKVRELLAIKQVEWQSVAMPNMMPKPDLLPLTGGYRRAPVMQIGADIFCDSQVIMAEIERRTPGADVGPSWPVNLWADRLFFQITVALIFGKLGDRVDPAFIADREKLSGRPFDVAAMAKGAGPARGHWRAQAAWIERALAAGGTPFLAGAAPGIADVAAHMNIWFLASAFPRLADDLLAGFGTLATWRAAMIGFGTGQPHAMTGARALEIAAASAPMPVIITDEGAALTGFAVGAPVFVAADDYGRDPIAGSVVAIDAERIIIARQTGDLGLLHLHFPRASFVVVARTTGEQA